MSNALASYVEKYILNPGTKRLTVDDEGNEETKAVITNRIEGEEGAKAAYASVSKLRIQNADLLGETDPRYKGKQTSRKCIKEDDKVSFDRDLAKYCIVNEDSDSLDDEDEEESDSAYNEEIDEAEDSRTEEGTEDSRNISKDMLSESEDEDYMRFAEDIEENEESSNDDDDDVTSDDDIADRKNSSAEENDHIKNLQTNSASLQGETNETEKDPMLPSIRTFSSEKSEETSTKAVAVKNQCSLFDGLFETRIGLQKVVSIANQLPQFDVYEDFLKNNFYPQYKSNLLTSRRAVKKLIFEILELQKLVLSKNSETKHILENELKRNNCDGEHSTSSDGERSKLIINEENLEGSSKRSKRKVEDFEETLKKRHKNMNQFRDETMNKWYEKSKLLVNQSRRNFGSFDVPPTQQIKNLFANKDQLIKRTQLIGVSRGNVVKILGKANDQNDVTDQYDPEIFDDSDFYSRMLEEILKSKISGSNNMTEVSRRWIDIQRIRKRAKRKVDTKASKGRKLRFEVISKLQQFLAPCKPSPMSDEATNQLFSSLFCGSYKK